MKKETLDKLESLVKQCVGGGSMCWEHVENAGTFDELKATEVSKYYIEQFRDLFETDFSS